MTIKEVEQELGIPRAIIRFYAKQNLINPSRGENTYRDYSKDDVEILKKIIIFRKIGLSVSDIEEIFDESTALSELVEKNIIQIREQINVLNGALKISREILDKKEEIGNFNEAYYWEAIHREEKVGNKFLDIANDTLKYEKKVVFEQFDIADNEGNLRYGKVEAIFRGLGVCILFGIFNYILEDRRWQDFLEGCCLPFIFILLQSMVGLPLNFLGKKHPELAKKIKNIGTVILVVITVGLLILAILI